MPIQTTRLSIFLAALVLFCALHAQALKTGFNQAWLTTNYSSSFLNSGYSEGESRRLLQMVKDANGSIIRMWLFEGVYIPSVNWDTAGNPLSLKPEVVQNIQNFLKLARSLNIQVYFTLFDGNSLRHSDNKELAARFKNLLNNVDHKRDLFMARVLSPLIHALRPYENSIFGIDLMNEMDFLIDYFIHPKGFASGWSGAYEFVSQFRASIHSVLSTPVTASFSFWFPVRQVLKQKIPVDFVDFYDVHIYNNNGEITWCDEIREFSRRSGKPLVLGEFGQFQYPARYSDELQSKVTEGFLRNAPRCGFKAALAWRLSDVRPGFNKEARYSYESYGKPRPAYYIFKALSQDAALNRM